MQTRAVQLVKRHFCLIWLCFPFTKNKFRKGVLSKDKYWIRQNELMHLIITYLFFTSGITKQSQLNYITALTINCRTR